MNTLQPAYLFPGQGTQDVTMLTPVRCLPGFRERADLISEAVGFDVARGLTGQEPRLLQQNLISSLLNALVSSLIFDSLVEFGPGRPAFVAGYSVGQLIGLYGAGSLTFDRLVELLRVRCQFMDEDCEAIPGAMLGVVGLPEDRVRILCEEISADGYPLVISNYNASGHYSLAGSEHAISRAHECLAPMGAKRVLRLPVSGAWHSPHLQRAARRFAEYLETYELSPPQVPAADNVTGGFLPDDIPSLRRQLSRHLCEPVRWRDCVKTIVAAGGTVFVEVGHGQMLTKMGFFIDRSVAFRSWETQLMTRKG